MLWVYWFLHGPRGKSGVALPWPHQNQSRDWKLLYILMEHLQLHIGFCTPLFQYSFSKIAKYCERTWLTSLWEFIDSIEATIHVETHWTLPPQRAQDVFVMEVLSNPCFSFSPKMLKRINTCRIFLQVLTLADICDTSGTSICTNILKGIRHSDRCSQYLWADQSSPSLTAWSLWNKALHKAFCNKPWGAPRLRQPLGRWTSHKSLHQEWLTLCDESNGTLVQKSQGSDLYFIHLPTASPRIFYWASSVRFTHPSHLSPASILSTSHDFIQATVRQQQPNNTATCQTRQQPNPRIFSTAPEYINSLHSVLRNSVGHFEMEAKTCHKLASEIRDGTAVIAGNGSVVEKNLSQSATQGWIIYGTKSKSKVRGHGTVPSRGQTMSSLRPKMGGLLGALTAVDAILCSKQANDNTVDTSSGTSVPLCALIDNMAVISRIKNWNVPSISNVLAPEYDILEPSRDIVSKHKQSLNPQHIKSHQDSKTDFSESSMEGPFELRMWQLSRNLSCLRNLWTHITLFHWVMVRPFPSMESIWLLTWVRLLKNLAIVTKLSSLLLPMQNGPIPRFSMRSIGKHGNRHQRGSNATTNLLSLNLSLAILLQCIAVTKWNQVSADYAPDVNQSAKTLITYYNVRRTNPRPSQHGSRPENR